MEIHKRSLSQWVLLLNFGLLVSFVMNVTGGRYPVGLKAGTIAPYSVRADRDYEIIDQEATEKLREEALRKKVPLEIKDVVIKVQRGESIFRAGDRIALWHVNVIKGIQKERGERQRWSRFLGTAALTLLLFGLLTFSGRLLIPPKRVGRNDLIFLGSLLITLLMVIRLALSFSGGIRELLPFDLGLSAFYFLLPISAGSLIVRLVLPSAVSLLFAVASSTLASLLLENSLLYAFFFLFGSLAATWLGGQVKTRTSLLTVGLKIGGIQALAVLILHLVNSISPGGMLLTRDLLILLLLAAVGGIVSGVLSLVLLPVFESLFNYLTPIKLLELGSLNHPLLREMIVRAPGTYHHSHMVGTLAEAACEAIGADALFARVASYFHDIGKLTKPPYFIENQPAGEDRHAPLAPSMSALIIASHVKEGIELAKGYKLPQRIIDIIPQHQGTKLITYFYSKAKEGEQRDLHVVDERDYRYPGPRPQTREAGVILLADTVEASTRALKDRSPTRLEEVVRNVINKNFVDGQLDECDLTLRDLQTIGRRFVRILMGIYHQRIEYPEVPKKEIPLGLTVPHADKYIQSPPLGENSLKEGPSGAPPAIPRIGPRRLS